MNRAASAWLLLCLLPGAALAAPARHHRATPTPAAARGGGGVSESRLLAEAIAVDSTYWIMNRYDAGSLTGVEVVARTPGGGATVRGNYTFNDGSEGWVEAEIAGGRVSCLRYWDTGSCDPVRGGGGQARATSPSAPSPSAARRDSTFTAFGKAEQERVARCYFAYSVLSAQGYEGFEPAVTPEQRQSRFERYRIRYVEISTSLKSGPAFGAIVDGYTARVNALVDREDIDGLHALVHKASLGC
ncbi:MAG: hypothetical protein QOG84_159 [Sphingomonadales bacterium]|jgi:hypothetical protein|nr:hypothetical protein [Sphingomonadales bacterium]